MIATIHQPNYLPWLGFFDKVSRADVFVSLDTAQFTKNGLQNRNRIKTPQGELWLTVPVLTKGRFAQATNEVRIDHRKTWGQKHWKSLVQNYARAPYFNELAPFFEEAYQRRWELLVELNEKLLKHLFGQFNVDARFVKASELNVEGQGAQLLVDICRAVHAGTYLSGPSGREYLDEALFARHKIDLRYCDFEHPVYPQLWGDFIPNLSAIDFLCNCGPGALLEGSACVQKTTLIDKKIVWPLRTK